MQCRADLAQRLRIGDQNEGREVSTVGASVQLVCQLFCKGGLVCLLDPKTRVAAKRLRRVRLVGLSSPSVVSEILLS